jgi:aryl-alcohol dehydrogenase-like predicted oxidoreductase
VIPLSARNGISQIVWSPLYQGILTGKYKPGEPPPAESRATSERMGTFMQPARDQALLERVQQLVELAAGLGLSPAQLALAWVLREQNVASAIIGATRP